MWDEGVMVDGWEVRVEGWGVVPWGWVVESGSGGSGVRGDW